MAAKKVKLSVALATFNEERNLSECLTSVRRLANEIVVVDGGSSDRTVAIAREFHAKIAETTNPPIFHVNKQKALNMCTGDWILQLDADEVVSPDGASEITRIINSKDAKDGYFVPRKNYFIGHWLMKGGQYPDYVIRLFRNGAGTLPCRSVHEQIKISGTVGYLTQPLLHYSNRTYADYWRKAQAYTSLTAAELKERHVGKDPFTWLIYMIVKPVSTFLQLYIRHKGFMDGIAGFQFALFSGFHHAIAYWKYLTQRG